MQRFKRIQKDTQIYGIKQTGFSNAQKKSH
nr:MAG TPA: hypothetical protein [Caudoviricetes sp.]